MNRRFILKAFGALTATLLLPPIRAAKARFRRLVNAKWSGDRRHWEHLVVPEPVATGGADVCRMLNPAKAPRTNIAHSETYNAAILRTGDNRVRPVNPMGSTRPYEVRPYSGPETESRSRPWVVDLVLGKQATCRLTPKGPARSAGVIASHVEAWRG